MIDLILKQSGLEYVVQVEASTSLSQQYSPIGGYYVHRFMNGDGFKQSNWKRTTTTITGNGYIADAMDGLDWDLPVEVWCIGERSLESTSNVIALPLYREDAPVTGFAIVGGRITPSTVEVDVDGIATIAVVTGATRYKVIYFPILTVFMEEPDRGVDYHESDFSWTLRAEEI
jgi:hypothetical protein